MKDCEKTGKIGELGRYLVSLEEVKEYLRKCYPKLDVKTVPPGHPWHGAFEITRLDGTYFWTDTWEGIGELAEWEPVR